MKKQGILNASLMYNITKLGHKDLFLICDVGMPIPDGVEIVDLALCEGVPSFSQVIDSVFFETQIEHYLIASEINIHNKDIANKIKDTFKETPFTEITHEELKKLSKKCKFAIRTGENTPYANIILQSGVIF